MPSNEPGFSGRVSRHRKSCVIQVAGPTARDRFQERRDAVDGFAAGPVRLLFPIGLTIVRSFFLPVLARTPNGLGLPPFSVPRVMRVRVG